MRGQKYNVDEILDIFAEEQSITSAAKVYCEKNRIPYTDSIRRNVSNILKKAASEREDELEDFYEGELKREKGYTQRSMMSAKKENGQVMSIEEYCTSYGIPEEHVKSYKLVTHTGDAFYNIQSNNVSSEALENFYKDLVEEIKNHAPKAPPTVTWKSKDGDNHCLVIDPADIHIGKLCTDFDTGNVYNEDIAVLRVLEGIDGILEKVQGFDIDQILFVGGNDVLHIDTPKRTTTSGTPQDTDGMFHSNFLKAKKLYIDCILKLREIAPVHFVFNPSNHDYMSGFFLADVVATYFTHFDDVSFDIDLKHRKYFKYGNNLIGTTHGDGAKNSDLGPLMAHESRYWSSCKHRYIYTHHVHHKNSKDFIGVTVESLRSPSGSDRWHTTNGYTGVPKAVEGFLHHVNYGQVGRFTHIF